MPASAANAFTDAQVERLCRLAPLFDLEVQPLPVDDMVTLVITDPLSQERELVTLPRERAIRRAMSEICSRTVRWVYYHGGEPASCAFFSHTDARLARIGELYKRWKAAGCPQ